MVRDNVKKITSVGLPYKDVILFPKIFYVFDVVYVKLNSILLSFLVEKSWQHFRESIGVCTMNA